MGKALLDAIPDSRRLTIYHEEDGITRVESRQDCERIVDHARALSYETPGKDFRIIGFMPEAALNQAFLEGWADDPKAIRRWLLDNPHFRVHKG
jgi:hypothetical protein